MSYNSVAHFAVHADDVERARAFYAAVFGWRFTAWGPPGFLLITTGTDSIPGVRGALQQRQAPLTGTGFRGYECTISVADIVAIAAAVVSHGGTILLPPVEIPTVGTMIRFSDTEGNEVGAMQYVARS
ncbi:MAG: VOC family protein [Phycisphaerae bacterium]|nr:VOC family protein [Gemmatimonadaceae bacterium]